ncbi:MAG: hypothetical protein WCB63_15080 [Polyangiales bacterium]
MKTNPATPCDPFAAAEQALADAGVAFTVVDRCPASDCPVCVDPSTLATAA